MKRLCFAFMICLVWMGVSSAQWRAATQAEIAFEKRISVEFEKILTDAAKKMSQPWTFQYHPAHDGPFDFDACDYIPHEVRVSMGLSFPGDSPDANRLEQELNRYDQIKDSLGALGITYDRESPWDNMEVWVEIVVNYSALSQGMCIDSTPLNPQQSILQLQGTQMAILEKYPGSSDRPCTRCWYGEVPFKNNPQTHLRYSQSKSIDRTDVINIILNIQTAPALAQEFYQNLDIPAIERVIREM